MEHGAEPRVDIEERKGRELTGLVKIAKIILTSRTQKCKHSSEIRYLSSLSPILGKELSWFFNWIFGFVQAAIKGFSIKVSFALFLSLIKRKNLLKAFIGALSKDTLSFSMYWGLMVGVYKTILWALRTIGKTDEKMSSIIAGVVCSLSTLVDTDIDRRKTLILYILARAVETSINFSNNHNIIKISRHIYILMYKIEINLILAIIHYKIACKWSCLFSTQTTINIFHFSWTRSNLISRTWKFFPVPENFLVY